MASVVIRVTDADGSDVVAVRVRVDGALLTDTLDGRAIGVDPGQHVFRFEAGKRVVNRTIVIREGERGRMLSVGLPPEPHTEGPRAIPIGAWVLGGIGVAAIGTGISLWIVGRNERADLYATCGLKHDCTSSQIDRARTKLVAGDVVAGVGLAAVAASVWWGLAGRSAPRSPVDVHPVAGGGVLSFQTAF
jgi:hypothetical protein